jgi:hypothetical protein
VQKDISIEEYHRQRHVNISGMNAFSLDRVHKQSHEHDQKKTQRSIVRY